MQYCTYFYRNIFTYYTSSPKCPIMWDRKTLLTHLLQIDNALQMYLLTYRTTTALISYKLRFISVWVEGVVENRQEIGKYEVSVVELWMHEWHYKRMEAVVGDVST